MIPVFLMLLWVETAVAQTNTAITLTPNQAEVTVGDPIQLVLAVTHPANTHVILPQLGETWGDFEIIGQSPPATETGPDGQTVTSQVIDARLFAPGTFETPPLTVTLSDENGQISEETAPAATVTVASILTEGDMELHDIKPQATLPLPAVWPWVAGGLLAVVAAGGAGWYVWQKRQRVQALAPVVDTRPPYQIALDELARIDGLQLPEQGHFKEHYTLSTNTMRRYVEAIYHVPAMDRTTYEIRWALKRNAVTPEHMQRLVNLFNESDLVKFAKFTPDTAAAHQFVNRATDLVNATRPVNGERSSVNGDRMTDY
ncbi:MAG: hypothetical protein KDE59_31635 [Anaerolineales bacterium]|nr:hypothetical protein [Anaerolineales bacterium]